MKVDAYASLDHYARHIEPIWHALPDEQRGIFYTPGRETDWWGEALPRRWPDPFRPIIVAAFCDLQKVRLRPVIYVEHGAGQSYDGDERSRANPSYSGGRGLEAVVLFVCPSEHVADRWRDRYDAPAVAVGCPHLDRWHTSNVERNAQPTIAVTFHWECGLVPETRSAWPHYDETLTQLVDEAKRREWRLLGHGHPRLWGKIERRWRQLDVERVPLLDDVFERADVLVADNTSAMWEFASLDRSIVVLDAPWYRRDVDHGLRFWTHADAGVRIPDGRYLVDAIAASLQEPATLALARRSAMGEVYAHVDGRAAERAAQAVSARLESPMPNPFKPRRRRVAAQTRDDATFMAQRLHSLGGITSDEVTEFVEAWRGAEVEFGDEARTKLRELSQLDDDTLRRMIAAYRGDDVDGLSDGGDDVDDLSQGAVVMGVTDLGGDPLLEEARSLVRNGVGVRGLTTWIGGDAERAQRIEIAEREQAVSESRDVRRSLLAVVERTRG